MCFHWNKCPFSCTHYYQMKKLTSENLLLIYIILLPLLDSLSFISREFLNFAISPTLIIRPLIPITVATIIFVKNNIKLKMLIVGTIYLAYAFIHLYFFQQLRTELSFGSLFHETQYITNYMFLILNLFIFLFIFYKADKQTTEKLKKYTLIAIIIYISSIYISIITQTYTTTYVEGMGIKGWFESGNSISAILLLGTFILTTMIKQKPINKIAIPTILFIGFYLLRLIGTRAGMFGFIFIVRNICTI